VVPESRHLSLAARADLALRAMASSARRPTRALSDWAGAAPRRSRRRARVCSASARASAHCDSRPALWARRSAKDSRAVRRASKGAWPGEKRREKEDMYRLHAFLACGPCIQSYDGPLVSVVVEKTLSGLLFPQHGDD